MTVTVKRLINAMSLIIIKKTNNKRRGSEARVLIDTGLLKQHRVVKSTSHTSYQYIIATQTLSANNSR